MLVKFQSTHLNWQNTYTTLAAAAPPPKHPPVLCRTTSLSSRHLLDHEKAYFEQSLEQQAAAQGAPGTTVTLVKADPLPKNQAGSLNGGGKDGFVTTYDISKTQISGLPAGATATFLEKGNLYVYDTPGQGEKVSNQDNKGLGGGQGGGKWFNPEAQAKIGTDPATNTNPQVDHDTIPTVTP